MGVYGGLDVGGGYCFGWSGSDDVDIFEMYGVPSFISSEPRSSSLCDLQGVENVKDCARHMVMGHVSLGIS